MSQTPIQFFSAYSENLPLLITSALGTIVTGLIINFALKTTRIQRDEPPLLPGALPFLGHIIQYGKDTNKVYDEARCVP